MSLINDSMGALAKVNIHIDKASLDLNLLQN